MIIAKLLSFLHHLHPPRPGQDVSHPLPVKAVPGLMTMLDVALFQSVEGELTATICSSHALLKAFLDLKDQAHALLYELQQSDYNTDADIPRGHTVAESFARACLEAASHAIERLSTEKLAQSANLSDPYDGMAGGSGSSYASNANSVGSQGVVSGILEGKGETGRRIPVQRLEDCWESPRLHCPDHVWADDSFLACQRLIRNLNKHPFVVESDPSFMGGFGASVGGGASSTNHLPSRQQLSLGADRQSGILIQLIQDDLPVRLYQFRSAMDADVVVTKRLYLVKCEYRAPFRAFLEGHQSVCRAPPMQLVDRYIAMSKPNASAALDDAKQKLQSLLESAELVESLGLEKRCEEMELDMGRALFPFSELGRVLDHKRARIKAVTGIIEPEEVPLLQETVRRLKCILCRKSGPDTSTGIRPLLLDLQGVHRDDDTGGTSMLDTFAAMQTSRSNASRAEIRLDAFIRQLKILSDLCKTRHAFKTEKKSDTDSMPATIVKGCTNFDSELLRCQFLDWHDMVRRQLEVCRVLNDNAEPKVAALAEEIRRAELEMSIAVASDQALALVRQRLEQIASDREKRFEVLKEMVEDVCLREMNLHVDLQIPDSHQPLKLKQTSALGFLGLPLQLHGEQLPVG